MSLRGKKLFWLALLALLVFVTDIYLYTTKQEVFSKTEGHPSGNSLSSQPETSQMRPHDPAQNSASNIPSQPTTTYLSDTPEIEEQKIIERASKLSPKEIQDLKVNSLDTSLNQDLRFESIYLLSQNPKAAKELAEIVLTPIPDSLKNRLLDFENILRAQAIEGIQNSNNKIHSQKILAEIIKKSDNTFLIERSQKAQFYLQNGGDDLETQDQKKLKATIDE